MTKLQDFLNSPISAVSKMHRNVKAGDLFGIELECEGRNVDFDGNDAGLLKDWAPHHDGSLRANHGSCCEWVFNGPVNHKQSIARVNRLFDYLDKRKARLVTSNRTSTHVHFNMGDKNAYQLVNMFILFSILEDILDRYCGEDRRGNLFCLSSRHAEEQVRWMQDSCFKNYNFAMQEHWRYCSFNFAAINKFGSVEFRGMRGLDNREDMLAWLSIISEFCEYACYKMKNPVDLVEMISDKTPKGFIKEVFSKGNVERLIGGLDENTINYSIFEGLRLVQMLCYKIGTEFQQVRLKGRDFWASFKEDAEPERDVDPDVFLAGGPPKIDRMALRGGRGFGDPLRFRRGQPIEDVLVGNAPGDPFAPPVAGFPDPEAVAAARAEVQRNIDQMIAAGPQWDQLQERVAADPRGAFPAKPPKKPRGDDLDF